MASSDMSLQFVCKDVDKQLTLKLNYKNNHSSLSFSLSYASLLASDIILQPHLLHALDNVQ